MKGVLVDCKEKMLEEAKALMQVQHPRHSVEPEWNYHCKLRDHYLKRSAINNPFHCVGSEHFAYTRLQVTARYILMVFARLYYGLLSDYALALNFTQFALSIMNMPVAPKKLNRMATSVFDRDSVGENKMLLTGT